MSLVTLVDYKTTLGITLDSEDTKLSQYSLEIDGRVKAFLGYDIDKTIYTEEIYNGNGTQYLFPKHIPVTTFTKLEIYQGLDSLLVQDWDEWNVTNKSFTRLILQDSGLVVFIDGNIFPYGQNNIRISYTAGYTEETLPQDIQGVCKELMFLKYQSIDQKKLGTTSKSRNEGGVSSTVTFESLEDEALKKIEHYRFIRV